MPYATSYRENYAEFLRIDFPRISFTSDYELFKKMAELGKRLVDLHLLRSPELDPPITRFQGEGDGKIEAGKKGLRYDLEAKNVAHEVRRYRLGDRVEKGSVGPCARREDILSPRSLGIRAASAMSKVKTRPRRPSRL